MKKIFLIFLTVFIALCAFANDGIQFTNGTWKEILSKAKVENNLVFIDVYTCWCGPCKMMAAETFPQKKVGDVFNANFINYKIDAEKGEGIAIAQKFEVRAFPTYLFVNGDGELVYRVVGYMKAEPFLEEANIAIREKNDPKPFVQWEKEYQNGKRDKSFLLAYMKKRALLKLPSAEIAEEVFPMLTKDELTDKEVISSIVYYDPAVQFVPEGKVFSYVMKNYRHLDSTGLVKYPLGVMETGITNYFRKNIIAGRKEKMLPVAISAMQKVMKADGASQAEITENEKELTYLYYDGTKNKTKLAPAVIDYVDNGLMKLDIAGKQKADAEGYKKFMEPYLNGTKDSLTDPSFAMMNRLQKAEKMVSVSYSLRSVAETVYKNFTDEKLLTTALGWAKQAEEWFPHFSTEAVYAGLLYKTGNKEEAIRMMTKASQDSFLAQAPDTKKLLLENAETMKQGKLPAGLWRVDMPTTVAAK